LFIFAGLNKTGSVMTEEEHDYYRKEFQIAAELKDKEFLAQESFFRQILSLSSVLAGIQFAFRPELLSAPCIRGIFLLSMALFLMCILTSGTVLTSYMLQRRKIRRTFLDALEGAMSSRKKVGDVFVSPYKWTIFFEISALLSLVLALVCPFVYVLLALFPTLADNFCFAV
jgi:hypothetical protein